MTAGAARAKAQPFNILLATAGEDESAGAVRAAALLARRTGGDVQVLTIVTPFPHAAPTGVLMAAATEVDEENRKASLERVREQLREVAGARAWPVRAVMGWPVDGIVAAARRSKASLIVLGIGEHSAAARLFGVETAVGVAKRAGAPVFAVPRTFEHPPVNAYAALDFSPSSVDAARLAARLVPRGGSVTLVHTSVFAKAPAEAGSMMDLYATGARSRLSLIAKQVARASGRRVKTLLAEGPVADALLAVADASKGDLIALGSHERGLIERLLVGSVRKQVLRHAGCPVLIVPQHVEAIE
jgi:nucleotide-binding universal stress UspA family protein